MRWCTPRSPASRGCTASVVAPVPGSPFGVYRPATIPSDLVPQYVHVDRSGNRAGRFGRADSGRRTSRSLRSTTRPGVPPRCPVRPSTARSARWWALDPATRVATPTSACSSAPTTPGRGSTSSSPSSGCAQLLPEAEDLVVERYRFPKIRSLNFVIRGLLDEGVAASTRQDAQAKALGEWLRARVVPIPERLIAT